MFNQIKYWTTEGIRPSFAERLIINILKKLQISYLREVSFEGLISKRGGAYRFDFYFPQHNLIIEYDGKKYHKTGNTKDIDKNLFCASNGIRIIRLNAKHFYSLEKHLKLIFKKQN